MYAVFPLNIVVLPEECVALHLFEPRYRQLFKDHKEGQEFVILNQAKGKRSEYGTLVYIDKIVNEFPDETVDVIVKGNSIVKINEFFDLYPGKLYSGVELDILELDNTASEDLQEEFEKYLQSINKRMIKDQNHSLFYIANRLELDTPTKKELVQLHNSTKINSFLLNQIKLIEKIKEQEDLLDMNFHLN